jgi:hypothetical protein
MHMDGADAGRRIKVVILPSGNGCQKEVGGPLNRDFPAESRRELRTLLLQKGRYKNRLSWKPCDVKKKFADF